MLDFLILVFNFFLLQKKDPLRRAYFEGKKILPAWAGKGICPLPWCAQGSTMAFSEPTD
jgi:hypothetical protein